ncbi:MAG: hypothetical protein H6734_11020 [Alphaproteobacteria bacterium]|nr:hypothetical protein [Alphaproteobacteria bacterium]
MRHLLPLLLVACSTSRAVRPLPAGTGALTASLGGPINADLGAPIPLPLTTIGYAYGVDGKTDVHAAIHPTAAAAFGVFGASVGVARQVWDQQGGSPRLMTDLTLHAFGGDAAAGPPLAAGRAFAELSGVLSWDVREHSLYTGTDLFFQPGPRATAHLSPLGGAILRRGRTGVAFEAAWLAPYVDNRPLAAHWIGPFHRGAVQLKLGLELGLGRKP